MRSHIFSRSLNSCHTEWHFSLYKRQKSGHASLSWFFNQLRRWVYYITDMVESKLSFHWLPSSTGHLPLLFFSNVASIFCFYFYVDCPEYGNCMLAPLLRPHFTCLSTSILWQVNQSYNSSLSLVCLRGLMGQPFFMFPISYDSNTVFLIFNLDLFTFKVQFFCRLYILIFPWLLSLLFKE